MESLINLGGGSVDADTTLTETIFRLFEQKSIDPAWRQLNFLRMQHSLGLFTEIGKVSDLMRKRWY